MTIQEIKINGNHRKPKPIIMIGEAEFKRLARKLTAETIRERIRTGDVIIGFIAQNPDPRGLQAIAHYQDQIAWLKAVLEEKENAQPRVSEPEILLPQDGRLQEQDKPPDIVIGLKTMKLLSDLRGYK